MAIVRGRATQYKGSMLLICAFERTGLFLQVEEKEVPHCGSYPVNVTVTLRYIGH